MHNFLSSMDKALSNALLHQQHISADQLNVALNEQKKSGSGIDFILVDLGYVCPIIIQKTKSSITGHPYADLNQCTLPDFLNQIALDVFHQLNAIPFQYQSNCVDLAMADPEDIKASDTLKRHLTQHFQTPTEIALYHADLTQIRVQLHSLTPKHDLDTADAPLAVLEHLISDAIERRASDVHFQPGQHHVSVRFRIDSILTTICVIHTSKWPQILNRLKVCANLDIAETRRPQSGHFLRAVHTSEIDIRVSTHPTFYGENIVLRLMDKAKRVLTLNELGFPEKLAHDLRILSKAPQGLIVLTGPTGAGKTTTLYALLESMDTETRNIMTLESPIEAILPGTRQTEIREYHQLSFSDGIRSLLRQDPDVILIGEIRDEETAQMALRAVLTGHLVLSTLHTQDVLGVPGRLIDLGLAPVLLAGALQGVIAQRLVRKICQYCRAKSPSSGSKCPHCLNGYKGRHALVEYMFFDEECNAIITKGGDRAALEKLRASRKFPTLWDHGLDLVNANITTHEELTRVLGKKPCPIL